MALSGYVFTDISVNITLASQPAAGADHMVMFTGPQANPGDVSISPDSMTFTHSNWATPQVLSVYPRRAGTVPINYEISAPYTARKKDSSFNVTATNLPPNVPVFSGSSFAYYNGGTLYGGDFKMICNRTSASMALGAGSGGGAIVSGSLSGTTQWEVTRPNGSTTIVTGFGFDDSQIGLWQFKAAINNPEFSALYNPTTFGHPATGPHLITYSARVTGPGYDSGSIVSQGPSKIYFHVYTGNYTTGGGQGPDHDAGSGATSDSWSLPFYIEDSGDGDWEITQTGQTVTHYPHADPVAVGKVSFTTNLDQTGDVSGTVTIAAPGTVQHSFAVGVLYSIYLFGVSQGSTSIALGFWLIYLDV